MPRSRARPLRVLAALVAVVAVATVALVAGALAPSGAPSAAPPPAAARTPASVAPDGSPRRTQRAPLGQSAGARAVQRALAADPTMVEPETSPLDPRRFVRPVREYRRYAGREADAMAAPVRALTAALRRDDRAAARRSWLAAYRRYLLLGAAYGALGALDDAIDGTPGGLPRGAADPRFRGLHRLERQLWTARPLAPAVPVAERLARDVRILRRRVRTVAIGPLDYATRAHEILEDAQRDFLSDAAAPWSGAGVDATDAAARATAVVLGTLRPLLRGRGDVLEAAEARTAALDRELVALRRAHGGRLPRVGGLRHAERARLTGRLGAALEALGAVPADLETTVPPAVPSIPEHR